MTNLHKGKIAFIFPANTESGSLKPTLNFKSQGDVLSITMGISFIDLNPESSYIVNLSITSPSGASLIDTRIDGIPSENIDPVVRTSFLSAKMHLNAKESGMHCFKCELIEMLQATVDKKEIYFNVFKEDDDERA